MEQQYILTEDTNALAQTLGANLSENFRSDYFLELQRIMNYTFPELAIRAIQEEEIEDYLQLEVQKAIDENLFPICLDRFLLSQNPELARLSITRNLNGDKTPRFNQPSFKNQLTNLKQKVQERGICLIDDGSFSGGTYRFAQELLAQAGLKTKKSVGYIKIGESSNIESALQIPENEITDWIDARDFSIFGGKLYTNPETKESYTKPYFPPFSDGSGASLNSLNSYQLLQVSSRLLDLNEELVQGVDKSRGDSLTLQEMLSLNFAIPRSEVDDTKISLDTKLIDFLRNECRI
jgi:hypothetical protein